MTEAVKDSVSANAAALLIHYSFDLNGCTADELVTAWASTYQPLWLRSAVIEALYQGRYKAISVEQILALWLRRGQPLYHFNHEFERIVCSKFPQLLVPKVSETGEVAVSPPPKFPPQSHWRYLLPGATKEDDRPSVSTPEPLVGASFTPVLALTAKVEEGSVVTSTAARSQPEITLPTTSAELASETPLVSSSATSRLNPSSLDVADVTNGQANPMPLEPQPETAAQPTASSNSSLPQPSAPLSNSNADWADPEPVNLRSVNLEPVDLEPATVELGHIATEIPSDVSLEDVSLESVLAEADRLLSDLHQVVSEPSDEPSDELVEMETSATAQAKPEPIHQFVPMSESSEFYTKLKAVAQPDIVPPRENLRTSSNPLSPSEANSQRA